MKKKKATVKRAEETILLHFKAPCSNPASLASTAGTTCKIDEDYLKKHPYKPLRRPKRRGLPGR
jgi:hypothetical protein